MKAQWVFKKGMVYWLNDIINGLVSFHFSALPSMVFFFNPWLVIPVVTTQLPAALLLQASGSKPERVIESLSLDSLDRLSLYHMTTSEPMTIGRQMEPTDWPKLGHMFYPGTKRELRFL